MAKTTKPTKQISEAAQAIINEGKAKMAEAKKLSKIVDTINDIGEWGLNQLETAIKARKEKLTDVQF